MDNFIFIEYYKYFSEIIKKYGLYDEDNQLLFNIKKGKKISETKVLDAINLNSVFENYKNISSDIEFIEYTKKYNLYYLYYQNIFYGGKENEDFKNLINKQIKRIITYYENKKRFESSLSQVLLSFYYKINKICSLINPDYKIKKINEIKKNYSNLDILEELNNFIII